MHALKVAFLVVLTLAMMRGVSWVLGWLISRGLRNSAVALMANLGAYLAFVAFLYWDRIPGELLDVSAALFGLVVYVGLGVMDYRRPPWKLKA